MTGGHLAVCLLYAAIITLATILLAGAYAVFFADPHARRRAEVKPVVEAAWGCLVAHLDGLPPAAATAAAAVLAQLDRIAQPAGGRAPDDTLRDIWFAAQMQASVYDVAFCVAEYAGISACVDSVLYLPPTAEMACAAIILVLDGMPWQHAVHGEMAKTPWAPAIKHAARMGRRARSLLTAVAAMRRGRLPRLPPEIVACVSGYLGVPVESTG